MGAEVLQEPGWQPVWARTPGRPCSVGCSTPPSRTGPPRDLRRVPRHPAAGSVGRVFPRVIFPMAAGKACTDPIWIKSKEFFFFFSFAVLRTDHQTTSFKPEPSAMKQKLGQGFLLFFFPSFFSLSASVGCKAGRRLSSSPSASPQGAVHPHGQPPPRAARHFPHPDYTKRTTCSSM